MNLFYDSMQILIEFAHGGEDVVGLGNGKVLAIAYIDGADAGSLCGDDVALAVAYHPWLLWVDVPLLDGFCDHARVGFAAVVIILGKRCAESYVVEVCACC